MRFILSTPTVGMNLGYFYKEGDTNIGEFSGKCPQAAKATAGYDDGTEIYKSYLFDVGKGTPIDTLPMYKVVSIWQRVS